MERVLLLWEDRAHAVGMPSLAAGKGKRRESASGRINWGGYTVTMSGRRGPCESQGGLEDLEILKNSIRPKETR